MRTCLYTFCVVTQTVYNAIFVLQPHLIRSWHSFEASSQSDQCGLICQPVPSPFDGLLLCVHREMLAVQICDYWKVARLACWIKALFWWWYTVNCSPLLNQISRRCKDVFFWSLCFVKQNSEVFKLSECSSINQFVRMLNVEHACQAFGDPSVIFQATMT